MNSPRPFELKTATKSGVFPKAFRRSTDAPALSNAAAAESEFSCAAR